MIVSYLRELDKQFISVEEHIDTSSQAGKLFFVLLCGMVEFDKDNVLSRLNQGRTSALINRGTRTGGHKQELLVILCAVQIKLIH